MAHEQDTVLTKRKEPLLTRLVNGFAIGAYIELVIIVFVLCLLGVDLLFGK